MERVIETLADGLGGGIGFLAETGLLFAVFALLWIGFGVGLVWGHGTLEATSAWIHNLPLLAQGVMWLLFLPVMAGLWVWETSWPIAMRLLLIAGVAGWNLLVLLPRALGGARL